MIQVAEKEPIRTFCKESNIGISGVSTCSNADPHFKWYGNVIEQDKSVDLLDYITRDAYFTGINIYIDDAQSGYIALAGIRPLLTQNPNTASKNPCNRDPWDNFKKYYNQLNHLTTLQKGWDSYDAEPPNEAAITLARRILFVLEEKGFDPSHIGPSVEGGVAISFHPSSGNKYGDFEVFNSGEILVSWSNRKDICEVQEIRPEENKLREAVERMCGFLNS